MGFDFRILSEAASFIACGWGLPLHWWPLMNVFQRHFFPWTRKDVGAPHPHPHIGGDPVTGPDCMRLHESALREDGMLPGEVKARVSGDTEFVEVGSDAAPGAGDEEGPVSNQYLASWADTLNRDRAARRLHKRARRQAELAPLVTCEHRHEVNADWRLMLAARDALEGLRVVRKLVRRVGLRHDPTGIALASDHLDRPE